MRIVVIGAVAAGTSAASQAKRRQPEAEVILLERDPEVSYGACGLPYNIADPARAIDDLVVVSAERFRDERKIDTRTGHEVKSITAAEKRLQVQGANERYTLDYDQLIIATGARAVQPPVAGLGLPGVFMLRTLEDGARVKQFIAHKAPKRALLVGAGYIGMEMAESLHALGLSVTVLERAPQVLPGFERSLAQLVESELAQQGVQVQTGVALKSIEEAATGLVVHTDRGAQEADLVMISVGVKPNVELAAAAGVKLGETGAIAVDDHMRTNLPDVYAAGDCAEALHLVSGKQAWIPLGTTANKQGRVAGANAAGGDERFRGLVGSAAFKVFDLEVGRTGLGMKEIEQLGLRAVSALSLQPDYARSFDRDARTINIVLFAERGTGRLLGAQMVGAGVVGKRIDVLATALHARMNIDDVAALDLSYAPPIAPVFDPVLMAAMVTGKELSKR